MEIDDQTIVLAARGMRDVCCAYLYKHRTWTDELSMYPQSQYTMLAPPHFQRPLRVLHHVPGLLSLFLVIVRAPSNLHLQRSRSILRLGEAHAA